LEAKIASASGQRARSSSRVLAGALAQRGLVDHVGRRAELGGEVAQPAAADHELAVTVDARAGREEVDDVAHARPASVLS
jgi:hypothetical protein